MNRDEIAGLCDEAARLLATHEGDAKITGYARTLAQCEFARLGYPLLALAVEYLRGLSEILPCGHPRVCLVSTDEGTHHCAWCEDKARWEGLLAVAADNAEGFRQMLLERERELAELKADAQLDAAMLARQCDLAREAEAELARWRMRAAAPTDIEWYERMRAVRRGGRV